MAQINRLAKTFVLSNKVILVTGGYGYLGKAAVEALIYHGATVYVLGRKLEEFKRNFKDNKNLKFEVFDVSSSNSIKDVFNRIYEREGYINVLINNAFYSSGQSPETMTDEDFSFGLEGVLSSVFKCIREIIPFFKMQGFGKIINVSSMYGMVAPDFSVYKDSPQFLNPPHYGAAKAGILQLTKYYASYLGEYGVQVNAISPGPFPSENVQIDTDFIERLKNNTLLKKIGKPEDLAGSFVFLSADTSDFITGQNIVVDGGWTAK